MLVIILGAGCIESNKIYIHAGETDKYYEEQSLLGESEGTGPH